MQLRKPRYGDLFEVELETIDTRGRPWGWIEHESGRFKAFVDGALPGDCVRASVVRRRRSELELRLVELLRASSQRTSPRCAHFGVCGGCRFQHLEYDAQLALKRAWIARHFELARIALDDLCEVVPCATPWRYRNKMDFSFSARRWIAPDEPQGVDASFALGLHPREQHSKVLSIEACPIQFEAADAIVNDARRLALEQRLSAWDDRTHVGLLRHLVLRTSRATGEVLVQLTTSSAEPELIEPYVRALLEAQPAISTLVQCVSERAASVAGGEHEIVWLGSGKLRERLAGLRFEISSSAFFQTNTEQAERLVECALEELSAARDERVLDLYCGAGAFSLPLARCAGQVLGVELSESAVRDARRNAELNAISNVRFECGDAAQWLGAAGAGEFDALLVDPPRAGIHPKALAVLSAARARRLVYVSCNPQSAARDAAVLAANGWRALRARPVDLFPHTPHVECVFTFERRA